MRRSKWSSMAFFFAVPVLARTDATYLLLSSNAVSPSSPTTMVEIWATWVDPGAQFIFALADYDLTAGDGVFSNPVNVLNGPGSSTGVIAGNVVSGGTNGQPIVTSFPPIPVLNPILLAHYEWATTDFTPRPVDLHTSNTSVFMVGIPRFPNPPLIVDLYPREFTPGSGVINVVPAPAVWVVLALPLAVATRRRRC